MDIWLPLLALACNLPLGYLIIRKQALTLPGGLIAAALMGLILFLAHPLYWLLLLVFFGSSTVLSRYRMGEVIKEEAMGLAEKGGQRDMFQVLANGGLPTILALCAMVVEQKLPVSDLRAWYSLSLAVALAVVNADTWATEIGVTSPNPPRSIIHLSKTIPRGSSGGISPRGLLASAVAAAIVAFVYGIGLLIAQQFSFFPLFLVVIAGLAGSLFDSLLGATIQAQYHCPSCDKLTEQRFHQRCQTVTLQVSGLTWFGNDLVNLVATILAILVILPFLG